MKTLPLGIEQASNGGGTHIAFRIVSQDETLIPRASFYRAIGGFNFLSSGCPDYGFSRYSRDDVFLRGSVRSRDDFVIIVPAEKAESFKEAVADLNKSLSPAPRVVVFRYAAGSKPQSVHEVEVDSEDSRYLCGVKLGDDGGYRKYLKKNIVGGKIVEL